MEPQILTVVLLITIMLFFIWLNKVIKKNNLSIHFDNGKSILELKGKTVLKFLGNASIKIKTANEKLIYIDPSFGNDYKEEAADIILVTHFHEDHFSQLNNVKRKYHCKLITVNDALNNNVYNCFEIDGIKIEAVPAYNILHPKDTGVGYILKFDDITLYYAGDTGLISEMIKLKEKNVTYALLPIDGTYTMTPKSAVKCAEIINAKYVIPIHSDPINGFNQKKIDELILPNKIILMINDIIELK